MPEKISLAEKFQRFDDHWAPRIISRYNSNEVRIAKVSGDFHWHKHDQSDELFLVVSGTLDMEFRDSIQVLHEGDLIVVPAGIEHRPRARNGEALLLMIDADGTPNTGEPETAFEPVEI